MATFTFKARDKAEVCEQLLEELCGYTTDNNRDLYTDPAFPLSDALEELQLEFMYRAVITHLARMPQEMRNGND